MRQRPPRSLSLSLSRRRGGSRAISALSGAALLFLLILPAVVALLGAPGPAAAASQTWYMTDTATGVPSGANYFMYRGSGNGVTDSLAIVKSSSKVWAANEAVQIASMNMSGSWSVTLLVQSSTVTCTFTMDIGVLSGGVFTSKGVSAGQSVGATWTTKTFAVTTTSHTISSGQYLAIRLNNTSTTKALNIDLHNTSGNSPSYVTSPSADPGYPGTPIISFTISDYNSDGVNFGSLDPGFPDQPADQTPAVGAVTLTVGSETNVNLYIQLKGTDFTSGGNTIAVTNVKYNNTDTTAGASTLTASYVTWYSVSALTADVRQCYHWISVPAGKAAGTYTSTFYYQAISY